MYIQTTTNETISLGLKKNQHLYKIFWLLHYEKLWILLTDMERKCTGTLTKSFWTPQWLHMYRLNLWNTLVWAKTSKSILFWHPLPTILRLRFLGSRRLNLSGKYMACYMLKSDRNETCKWVLTYLSFQTHISTLVFQISWFGDQGWIFSTVFA